MKNDKNTTMSDFVRQFDIAPHIKWSDSVGYIEMSGRRLAKVVLDTYGVQFHYVRFVVTILSKDTGKIDEKSFFFNDHLKIDKQATGRTDMLDHGLQCISTCGYHWYINLPETVEPICNAIKEYVGMFM